MIICCPLIAGPAKWPRREPPENIWLAEVGSSSATRTSTFFVLSPQHHSRLKISTLLTVTVVPKSMASQGEGSFCVWHMFWSTRECPPMSPSMHFVAGNSVWWIIGKHLVVSLVPQPTCSWNWHPDSGQLRNPTISSDNFSTNPIISISLKGWWLGGCNRLKELSSICKGWLSWGQFGFRYEV